MNTRGRRPYAKAGVDEPREQEALVNMLSWFKRTYAFRKGIGSTTASIGHFANVLDMGAGLGLVLTTDGVGTKLMIAQRMQKFDTIGIDCVANNVNDILCLGGEPIALLDYIAINGADECALEGIAKGLYSGAKKAHISIPGGEIAQVGEMLAPAARGQVAVDLVGTAAGVVALSGRRKDLLPLVNGKAVRKGDAIVGLLSSGLHSNGYSLARKVLLDNRAYKLDEYSDDLQATVGEELLEPTHIYVDPILRLLKSKTSIHGLVHISGGGLLNLARMPSDVSYVVDSLPETPPIFHMIQKAGGLTNEDMYSTFNMGIGFCVFCSPDDVSSVLKEIKKTGFGAVILGEVVGKRDGEVLIPSLRLVGVGEIFHKS